MTTLEGSARSATKGGASVSQCVCVCVSARARARVRGRRVAGGGVGGWGWGGLPGVHSESARQDGHHLPAVAAVHGRRRRPLGSW